MSEQQLPILRISKAEFDALLEYSRSLPTGTTPGKRWKRLAEWRIKHHPKIHGPMIKMCEWQIGEYDPMAPTDDEIDAMRKRGETMPKSIRINWYRPVIRVRAASEPTP